MQVLGVMDLKTILVIAGSDSFGGAGIQADIKTAARLDVHAFTALTAITAQNSTGIRAVYQIPPGFIAEQIETIIADIVPDAVKIGMLHSAAAIKTVARLLRRYRLDNIVVDPLLKASTGRPLLQTEAITALKNELFPLARVITPNLQETAVITGQKVDSPGEMLECAKAVKSMGPNVVITGGHLEKVCVDILYDGKVFYRFSDLKIETEHTHGSGCVFSTALAALLAKGNDLVRATELAHEFARQAVLKGYACGHGAGPVRPV